MKVCIPSLEPGGPDSIIAPSFEDAEFFDFYDVHPDGNFERLAETRPCTCWGPNQVEAVSRRGIEAIIVADISPSTLLKFVNASVRVLRADNPSVMTLLDSCAAGRLQEIGIDQFAKLGKK